MKKSSTLFLQAVIIALGIVTLFVMIRFPLTEGRAVNLDLFHIYADPFIVYGYGASLPFFVALYQVFMLLGYIGKNNVFSQGSIKALRNIKYCAIIQSIFIILAALYIRLNYNENTDEDPAGFIAIAMVTTFIAIVIATIATIFEKRLPKYKK